MRFPLIGAAYASASPTADYEALVNEFLETVESPNAPDRVISLPIPGLTLWTTLPNSPCRGLYTQNGRFFAVGGNTPYEVLEDKTQTALGGPMNVDANPCTFACSGDISNQLLISSGNRLYVYNLVTGVFTAVAAATAVGKFVAFLTNFFLSLDVANSILYVSTINDATAWPAGQIQQRSISGDKWQSLLPDGQYAWLFGGQKTDVYQLAGSGNTIFVPVQGVSINQGIGAPYSACIVNNAPEWLSANEHGRGMILRAENFAAVKRSTFAVDYALQGYSMLQDAVGWSHQLDGHEFYICNFPTARQTWCDDAARDFGDGWSQRGFWDSPNMSYQAYRPQYHAYCFGKHLVGDRESGNIYELDPLVATDIDGNGIRRMRRTSPLRNELNRVFYGQMILNMDVGIGTQTGQGFDPQVMMRFSDDAGRTWSNEYWRSAGKIGKWNTRVNWSNVGSGRQRVFEFVCSDPVPFRFVGGYVDAELGVN